MITTLDKTKSYLGISTTSYDDLLTLLIQSCQDYVENSCNRKFEQATYTDEEHNGGTNEIQARNYPIENLTKVEDVDGTTYEAEDYTVNKRNGCILLKSGTFLDGFSTIKISYTGGYSTIPNDLQLLVWKLVGLMFEQRKSQGKGTERVNSSEIIWDKVITDTDRATLRKYKRILI